LGLHALAHEALVPWQRDGREFGLGRESLSRAAASARWASSSRASISATTWPFFTVSPTRTYTREMAPVARAPILTLAPTWALMMPVASSTRRTESRSTRAVASTLVSLAARFFWTR